MILPFIKYIIKIGTIVIESIAPQSIANVFVKASGENSFPSCPLSANINKNDTIEDMRIFAQNKTNLSNCIPPKISVLLNIINLDFDYSKLKNIDNLYIPVKYFINKKYENILKEIEDYDIKKMGAFSYKVKEGIKFKNFIVYEDFEKITTANIIFAKAGVSCLYENLVQGSSSVFQMNICAENPRLRKYAKRCASF